MTPQAPQFTKATKHGAKLRLGLSGPAGSGKTYTGLLIATELAEGGKIALIDTEHGSAVKASDRFDFDSFLLDGDYHPDRYTQAIQVAEDCGYAALVIDSLSHAWKGNGGLLQLVDRIAASKYKGNTYMAWNDGTTIQNNLVDAILRSKLHIIATFRSKQDYVVERDERTGKMAPKRVGLAPVQRDDIQYEFDIWGQMDHHENTMVIEKSRCPELVNQVIQRPDEKLARIMKDWLSGDPAPVSDIQLIQEYMGKIARREGVSAGEIKALCLGELGQESTLSIGGLSEDDETVSVILGWCEDRVQAAA